MHRNGILVCRETHYHWSSATSSLTSFSPVGVMTVAWLTSGYWVEEWFPHIMTFFTLLTCTFNLSAIWPWALLWSSRVRQVMFFAGIEGANSFRMRALVFAGLATTTTWNYSAKISNNKRRILKNRRKNNLIAMQLGWACFNFIQNETFHFHLKWKKNNLEIFHFHSK